MHWIIFTNSQRFPATWTVVVWQRGFCTTGVIWRLDFSGAGVAWYPTSYVVVVVWQATSWVAHFWHWAADCSLSSRCIYFFIGMTFSFKSSLLPSLHEKRNGCEEPALGILNNYFFRTFIPCNHLYFFYFTNLLASPIIYITFFSAHSYTGCGRRKIKIGNLAFLLK